MEILDRGDVAVDHLSGHAQALLAAEDGGGGEVDQLLEHLFKGALLEEGRHVELGLLAAKPGQLALGLVGQPRRGDLLALDAGDRRRAYSAKAADARAAGSEAGDHDRDQADDEDHQHDLRHEAFAENGEHLVLGPAMVRAGHRSAAGLGQAWHWSSPLLVAAAPAAREGQS